MINECEDKMICDFAETYHITNYKELPPSTAAALLIGLRDNSRVKMHLSGTRITLEQSLLAIIVDRLNFIAWTKTKDAAKGHKYKAKSIYEELSKEPKKKDDVVIFNDIESYENYMKERKWQKP